jgi:predicted transcriptional regulator
VGRSFQYAPLADEAGLAARRLTALLDDSADREAVLSKFVADLPDGDEELLRRLLSRPGGSP